MATLHNFISDHLTHSLYLPQNPNNKKPPKSPNHNKLTPSDHSHSHLRTKSSSSNKNPVNQGRRKPSRYGRESRGLITISTAGRWQGQWRCEFLISLRDLQLSDLDEEGDEKAGVFVCISVQKHASFGFSVDGRIITSIKRKCSCCFSSYYREIDTTFDVWVLPSGKHSEVELPEDGGSDQVIYVKPGAEADLDSVVQDTIRLIVSTKDTCSEACDKSVITWQCVAGVEKKRSYDQRWSQLLELKNAIQYKSRHKAERESTEDMRVVI